MAGSLIDCPEWLNPEFFEEIYRHRNEFEDKDFVITVLKCEGVVGIGENFVSTLYRVKVSVKVKEIKKAFEESFIVKHVNSDVKMLKEHGMFAIECEAYEVAVPAFELMWKKVKSPVQLGPRCLKISRGDPEVLVFTDLKKEGFIMMDRFKGLELEHAELTLAKLAKLHAASILFKERFGDFPDNLNRKFSDQFFENFYRPFIEPNTKSFIKVLENMEIDPSIVEKVRKWPDFIVEAQKCLRTSECDAYDLKVMVHGDLWVNNQMYKVDRKGRPTEVVFIDYQVMFWGRPATDIYYFLISSLKPNVVVQNWEYLIRFYHGHLANAMTKLGAQQMPPSFKQFYKQMDKYGFYAATALIEILPAVLLERASYAHVEGDPEETSEQMRQIMFNNPRYKKAIFTFLNFFETMGFLEFNEEKKKSDTPKDEF